MKQINLSTKRFDLIGFKLFLAIYFLSQYGIIYSQTWNQTTSFPGTPRDDASHFKIGTKHFIGTGREVAFGCTRDFYFFDESTLSWGNSSPLPAGKERQYASGISYNGKGFIFGGIDCAGVYQNDLWTYNPTTDSWNELNSLPSAGRAGMVQFLLQDTLYIVGGRNTSGIMNEVWTYNFSTQTWTQKNNLPSNGIWRGVAFTFQNNAFIGLGRNNLNNQTGHNAEILNYQPSSDSWTAVSNLSWGTRSYVGCAQTDSLLFLFGGLDSTGQILTSVERIHLSDFTTDLLPNFPSDARKGGVAFLVQNDLYYTTGVSTDTRFNETWRLDNVAYLEEVTSFQFQIFPNPCSTEMTIKASEPIISIEIMDELGRILFKEKINAIYFQLLTSFLKSGNYFVKIETENYELMEKLVINR
jgi:N-acetylneuraminic acid mutarotase